MSEHYCCVLLSWRWAKSCRDLWIVGRVSFSGSSPDTLVQMIKKNKAYNDQYMKVIIISCLHGGKAIRCHNRGIYYRVRNDGEIRYIFQPWIRPSRNNFYGGWIFPLFPTELSGWRKTVHQNIVSKYAHAWRQEAKKCKACRFQGTKKGRARTAAGENWFLRATKRRGLIKWPSYFYVLNFLSRSNCESGFKVVPVARGGEKKRCRDKSKVAGDNAHNVPLEGENSARSTFCGSPKKCWSMRWGDYCRTTQAQFRQFILVSPTVVFFSRIEIPRNANYPIWLLFF